ncbi:homeobox protein 2-like [Panonychus citri]|uniref:homeobox protein 2-like n=1 Tax=Panonychus citri TaxID=50023 RepID=UPI002307CD6A|nr:homeobox protein 2-like [Panonychus citri]
MTSIADRHLYPIFMLPSKLFSKFRGWIYGYIRLLLGMVCSVSCLFCVFTFIWYLTFRGLYGFLINLQLCQQPTGCGPDDDENDLNIEYTDYQSGKRGSFLTRCRAQAELIQKSLKKSRSNGDNKSPNGHNVKQNNCNDTIQENNGNNHHHRCHNHNQSHSHSHHHHHHHHNSPTKENSAHGVLVRNSSYVSEVYYDENGHKIGEQIYLTNDSDGLEESYFQFKVNDYQHLKELGAISTSVLVEEEPFDGGAKQETEANVENSPDNEPQEDKHGASGGDCEEKIVDSGDDNGSGSATIKESNMFHLSVSHSPESTTSYCGSILTDEPDKTTSDQQSTLLHLKSENQENDSSNSNYPDPDNICSTTTTNQVQLNKYPIESIKEEETKDSTINLVTIPDCSIDKVNCDNINDDKPNGVQLNGNATGEKKQTTNGDDTKSKSVNEIAREIESSIKDQSTGPSKRTKKKRRYNNNYNRSKNS